MQNSDAATVKAALEDWRSAPIPENLKATLNYLEKLVSPEQTVEESDIQRMNAAGVSRIGMEEATLVAFSFQTLTRMADAMDWPLATEKNLKYAGPYLYKNGYSSLSIPG